MPKLTPVSISQVVPAQAERILGRDPEQWPNPSLGRLAREVQSLPPEMHAFAWELIRVVEEIGERIGESK